MFIQKIFERFRNQLVVLLVPFCSGCGDKSEVRNTNSSDLIQPQYVPLIASRFESLEEFKKTVDIEYEVYNADTNNFDGLVRLRYGDIVSELRSGISQNEIVVAREKKIEDLLHLLVNSPYAIRNRVELNKIYKLSRRRPLIFGEGDVAFFDLALSMVSKINFEYTELKSPRDTSEKAFINTFNHIVAQAFITSIYSEEMADFVADVHELKNMPELVHGRFSHKQLNDTNNNPVDNYVDMINNEIGQSIGIYLRDKYSITAKTKWTNDLLVDYLNDVVNLTCSQLNILMEDNHQYLEIIIHSFSHKLNKENKKLSYFDNK